MIAVHVTHEAAEKMGGIGSVIAGLVTSKEYQKAFTRTVLVGPLLDTDHPAHERLGKEGKIFYSSLDGLDNNGWAVKFKPIERTYQVGIIYGTRRITDVNGGEPAEVEVILVDVFSFNKDRLNLFKGELFTRFAVPSDRFESVWEFEQYVRLAEPGYEAIHAIGCQGSPGEPLILLAHEYMGLPMAMKAMTDVRSNVRTVFYAHEVAPVREVVEKHPGHELMFYNVMRQGQESGKCLTDYFPQVKDYFKFPLVKAARHCDAIFAVGELVRQEMMFLDPGCPMAEMEVVYNGVPTSHQTLPERLAHRNRMRQYARNLFGFEPDFVFTHVARPVLSKGIWRDLAVLHELDRYLQGEGKTGVYFMLGTLAGQRRLKDVLHMERVYGWPVHHDRGYPDLCNGEETLGDLFEQFNRNHPAIRVVLINQFGWQRDLCGMRMPEDTSIADIRRGTDVEFGMSVYEPFGISQLEPLSSGAICVVSSVCGCASLLHRFWPEPLPPNVLEADFTHLFGDPGKPLIDIGWGDRQQVESIECKRVAEILHQRLPRKREQFAELLSTGWDIGSRLNWEKVVEQFVLPAIRRAGEIDGLEAT